MTTEQMSYYHRKLSYEMDSWDLFVGLQEGQPFTVIDGRSAKAFDKEHIPSAVNQPHKELCFNTTTALDKSRIYVCYCDGIGCNASTKTALKLLTLGFQVRELIGGLDWWIRDGYATEGQSPREGTDIVCGC
jgi:rhodanese-related sulfurtransferase